MDGRFETHAPRSSYWQDWAPFEHPQLGRVEIGGWRWWVDRSCTQLMLHCHWHDTETVCLLHYARVFSRKFLSQNPPPCLLDAELEKNTGFAMVLAQALPRVEVRAPETANFSNTSHFLHACSNTYIVPHIIPSSFVSA